MGLYVVLCATSAKSTEKGRQCFSHLKCHRPCDAGKGEKVKKEGKDEERQMLQICYFGDNFVIFDSECGSVTRIKSIVSK